GYHAPYPPPFLCGASPAERSGPSVHSGDAGPCGYLLYADLYPGGKKAAQRGVSEGPSPCLMLYIWLAKAAGPNGPAAFFIAIVVIVCYNIVDPLKEGNHADFGY